MKGFFAKIRTNVPSADFYGAVIVGKGELTSELPSEVAMPVCPIQGKNQEINGSGDQTMQYGKRLFPGSMTLGSITLHSRLVPDIVSRTHKRLP